MTIRRISLALLLLYALMTIYSIFGRPIGIAPASIATPLVTLAGFSFAFVHAGQREGWSGALRFLALVFFVSLIFESVGVATGIVYGPYHYTNQLGPKFLGLVPYLIPVAWFMMSYPSFVIADRLVPDNWNRPGRILTVAAIGGLAMTAWDLVMDPAMVAGGNWVWDRGGAYFGIPLQNFWGWWLTVFTCFSLYLWLFKKHANIVRPAFDRQAMGSYFISMSGITVAALLGRTGNFVLIGLFAMLPWVLTGWLRTT
jgi:uncharacterized membrane protein